ncbi:MAG: hypothetical protein ACRDJW_01170 [Thermomicrobiales bacterium]
MTRSSSVATRRTLYVETFEEGAGGWLAWGFDGAEVPEVQDGVFVTRSPWWVDPNHAPPGAGYLHLLAYLDMRPDLRPDLCQSNRFVEEGYSRDLTDARVTVRLRGDLEPRGAQLVLLAQIDLPATRANFVLTGQPFQVTRDWSEQTVVLTPDPTQWVCLGSRHNRADFYGCGEIAEALRDVNVNIIFVLFPLTIVPLSPVEELHLSRPHHDYEVDRRYLPEGDVQFDTVRIEYADNKGE